MSPAVDCYCMSKYRVNFIYGSWHLWADIERPKIEDQDRRSFADLAQLAVNTALELMPSIERKHIAHDYLIFELFASPKGSSNASLVYVFDSLTND